MTRDNNIKIGTVLHIVSMLLLTISTWWIKDISCRLRSVELNLTRVLAMHNERPISAVALPTLRPGESITVDVTVNQAGQIVSVTPGERIAPGSVSKDIGSVLRNPGPF
jgi:hypothetical protein